MIVYRLSRKQFSADLTGKGAQLAGGRWNSIGKAVIYTSESRALCVSEIAVHTSLGIIPDNYVLVTIEIPDDIKITSIKQNELPPNWRSFPYSDFTRLIGDTFLLKNKGLVLQVPSAVIPGDYNYLINPEHIDINRIRIINTEPFLFDKRLFDKK
jgi:RES domain-containing protein